jgi:hypothetical protein
VIERNLLHLDYCGERTLETDILVASLVYSRSWGGPHDGVQVSLPEICRRTTLELTHVHALLLLCYCLQVLVFVRTGSGHPVSDSRGWCFGVSGDGKNRMFVYTLRYQA